MTVRFLSFRLKNQLLVKKIDSEDKLAQRVVSYEAIDP